MSASARIYVAAHFPVAPTGPEGYRLIQVGHSGSGQTFSELVDSTGDNISHMNPSYCELTAHYWIWKNAREDLVGVMHYRRYLSCPEALGPDFAGQPVPIPLLREMFKAVDILVPRLGRVLNPMTGQPFTVRALYDTAVSPLHLPETREVLIRMHPDHVAEFDRLMEDTTLIPCNILVTRKAIFDEYCAWLFPILAELEQRLPYRSYGSREARVFGYLGERLQTVWIRRNMKRLAVGHLPLGRAEHHFQVRDAEAAPVAG